MAIFTNNFKNMSKPGSLLTILECPVKGCNHSQMVYKLNKLCDGAATCSHFKKNARVLKKAAKFAESVQEQD